MNLQRECKKCLQYFPVKPLELKFLCGKKDCEQTHYLPSEYLLEKIKKTRFIAMDYFDLYDLDRPHYFDKNNKPNSYERVCRICGKPQLNRDGKYSPYKRYCNDHNGEELWTKYNWGIVSKNYAFDLKQQQQESIIPILENIPKKLHSLVILCESCGKACLINNYYYWLTFNEKRDIINIHHKVPVHTLNWDNLHLIWNYSNLIALCPECHNSQDHQLKKISQLELQFQKITDFI